MTDITELAQSLKAAAEKWQEAWGKYDKVEITIAEFIRAANQYESIVKEPANVIALVEALEKAQAKNALVAGGIEAVAKLHERIAELEDAEQKLCAANVTLDARAELAERQLAELESRTVKLPPTFWYEHDDLSRDVPVLDKRLVKKMLREAGIKVEAE
ncbi:hypothetical protein [Klebsiella pneumoniae]|uniref:hypothetical protein n=1 Tax=Klebsiella pneumoniae TaxID=573 RepID=UPI00222F6748|nr:hypothetical protein [Klebsiella pneumoniae]MDM9004434.1 hypothetical protein [Klebsiella pneumoniae]